MFLGIEIGGTKLQLGIGDGLSKELQVLKRSNIDPSAGASGIRHQIEVIGNELKHQHDLSAVGIGFGGPFNQTSQKTIKSHQIEGWDDFPLHDWATDFFECPIAIENDADTAGLAEAIFGAGAGASPIFYLTVGTGIGGGLIINQQIYHGGSLGASEIGHLRPGLQYEDESQTVESIASGWGIAEFVRDFLLSPQSHSFLDLQGGLAGRSKDDVRQKMRDLEDEQEQNAAELLDICAGSLEKLTTKQIVDSASIGNFIAKRALARATKTLGWAIAQVITLTSPEKIVIGGGVSLAGDSLFFDPIREEVKRYVFPPYQDAYQILPAALGEEMVVIGALLIAKQKLTSDSPD